MIGSGMVGMLGRIERMRRPGVRVWVWVENFWRRKGEIWVKFVIRIWVRCWVEQNWFYSAASLDWRKVPAYWVPKLRIKGIAESGSRT
jgi:hypothetical protein